VSKPRRWRKFLPAHLRKPASELGTKDHAKIQALQAEINDRKSRVDKLNREIAEHPTEEITLRWRDALLRGL
jgi:hypothetical protein